MNKLLMLVLIYCIGVINGWIGGYEYAQRHPVELKEKNG